MEQEGKKEEVLKRLKNIEGKNKEQLKAIKDQGKRQLDTIKANNQLKDDKTKNVILLKDGLKELTGSYPNFFNTFTKNELKQLATKEEDIDYKKLSQEIFFYGFNFLEKYSTPYKFLKNLIANKISINIANDDQKNFVFNLMKGYNVSSFFTKSDIRDLSERNLYEKSRSKAFEILLKCEKSVKKDKKNFFQKNLIKTLLRIKKCYLISEMQLLVCLQMDLLRLLTIKAL